MAGTPRYAITHLRALATSVGAYTAVVRDINDNGIAVGSDMRMGPHPYYPDITRSYDINALRWDLDGTTSAWPITPSNGGASAVDIDNTGRAIGIRRTYSPAYLGELWTLLPSGSAQPSSNWLSLRSDNGQYALEWAGDTTLYRHGPDGVKQLQGIGLMVSNLRVNDRGDVVGSDTSGTATRAYRYFTDRAPVPLNGSSETYAYDLNQAGLVAGAVVTPQASPGSVHSHLTAATFSGSSRTFWDLPVPADQHVDALLYSINDQGWAVGRADFYGATWGYHAVIGKDGILQNLDSLVVDAGWRLGRITAINNRGQIIGNGYFDHDNNPATPSVEAAYRLDPIRSPGDTNYDDVVDFADLLTLAQHYGRSGNGNVFWETGDFNYDWVVDFDDLLTLAQNYDGSASFVADWNLAQSMIPEPSIAVGGLLVVTLGRSRRR